MLVDREFSIGSTDHPQIEIFPYSHYLSGWICIDIVRRVDFSITPMADFLFLALKRWSSVVCNHQTLLTIISLSFTLASLHTTKAKNHNIVFTGQKCHLQLVIGQMLIYLLWGKPSNLSEFVQFIANHFFKI